MSNIKRPLIEDDVFQLIDKISRLTWRQITITPASSDEINRFEKLHKFALPGELKAWFERCNGIGLGPGGIYSLFSKKSGECSIDWYFREYPKWKEQGRIPITDDGCGDVYVLATSIVIPSVKTHPVLFWDQADENPTYVVASGLWRFLAFFLEDELLYQEKQQSYWPFSKDKVVAADPEIVDCKEIALPWIADENSN
jgi:hypothetical protein